MPRDHRPQERGLTYHVTARGNRKGTIYEDDYDRYRFLDNLIRTIRVHGWRCHAYCLMTTHYHLLITTPNPNLAVGMHMLNSRHAHGFNRRHKLSGHVFESRYRSVVVERESHLLELFRYIALNPVRAGVCLEPEHWPWSSYSCAIGLRAKPEFLSTDVLTESFASEPERARAMLHDFVSNAER